MICLLTQQRGPQVPRAAGAASSLSVEMIAALEGNHRRLISAIFDISHRGTLAKVSNKTLVCRGAMTALHTKVLDEKGRHGEETIIIIISKASF